MPVKGERVRNVSEKHEIMPKRSTGSWNMPETIRPGLWKIEIDQTTGRHVLEAEEEMFSLLGIPVDMGGEERWLYWLERVAEKDRDYVNWVIQLMIAVQKPMEAEFGWNHPRRGEIRLCWTGIFTAREGNTVVLEGYGRIMEDIIRISSKDTEDTMVVEKKYLIKSDFYQTLLSEMTGYMEVDLDSGIIHNSGGIWKRYAQEGQEKHLNFQSLGKKYIKEVVIEQDFNLYTKSMDLKKIKKMYREGKNTITCQFRRLVGASIYHWMELVIHVFEEGESGKIYGLFYIKDIDETKRKYLEQERAAATDPLTNVMNRRNFEMLVREAIQRRKRTEKCALLVFDIDNFKKINDARGHQAGDQVLKEFSKILTEAFRKSDAIGRFGGDEFVVFVKGMPEKAIDQRLGFVKEKIKEIKAASITCSIGICSLTAEKLGYDQCLERADQALYQSKKKGKDTFCYWHQIS